MTEENERIKTNLARSGNSKTGFVICVRAYFKFVSVSTGVFY